MFPSKPKPTFKAAQSDKVQSVKNVIKNQLLNGLYLVATPIGNLGDISTRALETLKNADLILAEDTRMTKKLLGLFGISGKIERADEEATENAIRKALVILEDGGAVAFASDAGTPSISDPGQRLAKEIIAQGYEVFAIPGASSVLTALVSSGLEAKQFAFLGFVPNKSGARAEFLKTAANMPLTTIMFETGPRLLATLDAINLIAPNRQIAVTRELTKLYEEKKRGEVSQIWEYYNDNGAPKGEIVIVLEGQTQTQGISEDNLAVLIIDGLKTEAVKDLSARLAKETGQSKREIYQMALQIAKENK